MSLQQLVCDGEPLPNDAKVPVPADLHLVLISSEGATDEQKKDMTNELVLYANEGEVDVVRLLLKAGVDPDGLDDYLDTALVNASFYGYLEVVRMLLGARASTTLRERSGDLPLVKASGRGHLDNVRILLEAGADKDLQGCRARFVVLQVLLLGT